MSWINSKTYRTLETTFYVGSLYCTLLSLTTFIMAFHGVLTIDDFSTVNMLYWPTVLMYSTLRKTRRAQNPNGTPYRPSELILIVWMLVGLIGATVTITFRRDMFPLMKEMGILYLILLGILLGGKAIENIISAVLAPKK